jgi:hypothetical protein
MNPIPIAMVIQLGQYLKTGMDHYSNLKMTGQMAGPDAVAAFLLEKMKGWDPKVSGKGLLDEPTRAAAARFLAGVAVNLTGV